MSSPARFRHLRRNFVLFLLDYIAFGVALSLIGSSGAVVPSFVSQVTDSKQLIGLAGSLYLFCWLIPQLALAQIVNRRTRRKPFMRPVVVLRLSILLIAVIIALVGPGYPSALLLVFLVGYGIFAAGDALIALAWGDMLGSSLPNRLRGVLFGTGQFGVSIGALGMSALARWALGPEGLPFPQNYALLFGTAGALFLLGGACLAATIEEESEVPLEPGPPLRQYMPFLGNVLRVDKDFRRFTRTRLLLDLAMMAAPFYVVFGMGNLGLPGAVIVSDSIILIQVGSAVASVLMGWISRRSGSRAVIVMAGVFIILEPSLALLSAFGGGQAALYGAFFMLGAFHAVAVPTYFDWIITHAPRAHRPIYLGLTNTISALSNLGPFIGGTLLTLTAYPAIAGAPALLPSFLEVPVARVTVYPVLFGTAALLALAGLLSSLTLPEPRRRAEQTPTVEVRNPAVSASEIA